MGLLSDDNIPAESIAIHKLNAKRRTIVRYGLDDLMDLRPAIPAPVRRASN